MKHHHRLEGIERAARLQVRALRGRRPLWEAHSRGNGLGNEDLREANSPKRRTLNALSQFVFLV